MRHPGDASFELLPTRPVRQLGNLGQQPILLKWRRAAPMVDSGTPAARNDQTAATVQAAGLDRSKVDSPSIFQELIIAQVTRQITREEAEALLA
ncbi:hypothetical protein FHX35_001160 [Auritidibacter ignavus]|nr:hypothetical protein [Auritidibacter ignavus]